MSINKGMGKEGVVCVYTMEYYSLIKKYEIMPLAATWVDLERSYGVKEAKDKYYMILFASGI